METSSSLFLLCRPGNRRWFTVNYTRRVWIRGFRLPGAAKSRSKTEAKLLKRSVYATSVLVALVFGLLLCPPAATAAKHPQLPPRYEHWLNEEVNYLISNQEQNTFLGLTSDQDRDRFIDTFWAIRNPDPTAPGNTFREEHYRRLDYANTHYGSAFAPNGWRTDRGMVYITLGPPAQKSTYTNTKYLLAYGDLVLSGSGKRACALFFCPVLPTEPGGRLPDLLALPGPAGKADRQHQCR